MTVDKSLFDLNELVYCVDNNDHFIAANNFYLESSGFANEVEIIGKGGRVMPWSQYTPIYVAHNNIVRRNKRTFCCIEPVPTPNSLHCLSIKSPILSSSNHVLGVKGVSIPVIPFSTNELMGKFVFVAELLGLPLNSQLIIKIMSQIGVLEQESVKTRTGKQSFDYAHVTFTLREAQCLHYLLNNYSANETAKKLFISRKTVEFHLANIKLKLDCDTKTLSQKAMEYGFIELMFMKF